MQFQEKLMNQTWENDKKPSCQPNFDPFGQNLGSKKFFWWILPLVDVRHCCKLSLYAISRKTNEPNLKKSQKKLVSSPILTHLAQIRAASFLFFFSKIWLCQSSDIMVSYHHVQYQKKTNDPILSKLSDGRTDRRTDVREWFHRTLSD